MVLYTRFLAALLLLDLAVLLLSIQGTIDTLMPLVVLSLSLVLLTSLAACAMGLLAAARYCGILSPTR
jgi:hypothetical protein